MEHITVKKKKKKIEWSKFLTIWILLLNTYVIYHGIHLCYLMIELDATSYSFNWLTTLISVVVGLGDVVLAFYFSKSKAENKIKLEKILSQNHDRNIDTLESDQFYP